MVIRVLKGEIRKKKRKKKSHLEDEYCVRERVSFGFVVLLDILNFLVQFCGVFYSMPILFEIELKT